MDEKPTFRPYLLSTLVMLFAGLGGLLILINASKPYLWERWLLYFMLVIAATGTALFPAWLFNTYVEKPAAPNNVFVRQALWLGVYLAVLLWLEMGRVLTFGMGLILGGAVIVIEYLLRVREKAQKPPAPEEPESAEPAL